MGGTTIFGTLLIGSVLTLGHYFFPDSVIMWFASSDATIVLWRETVVAGVASLAVVREYYHNLYLQLLWWAAAAGLAWAGGLYFLNNPSHVFDTMLLLSASVAFAISALVPCADPVKLGRWLAVLIPGSLTPHHDRLHDTTDQLAGWRYIADARQLSHRLVLREQFDRTAKV